jgi:hypothetical protein
LLTANKEEKRNRKREGTEVGRRKWKWKRNGQRSEVGKKNF